MGFINVDFGENLGGEEVSLRREDKIKQGSYGIQGDFFVLVEEFVRHELDSVEFDYVVLAFGVWNRFRRYWESKSGSTYLDLNYIGLLVQSGLGRRRRLTVGRGTNQGREVASETQN